MERMTTTAKGLWSNARGQGLELFQVCSLVFLGGMLVYSSLIHLANPYSFYASVLSYQLVPVTVARFVAIVLPFAQAIIGICLIGFVFIRGATLAASALFGIFFVAQASALMKGLKIPCGCFGDSRQFISIWSVALVLALLVLSLICFYRTGSGRGSIREGRNA